MCGATRRARTTRLRGASTAKRRPVDRGPPRPGPARGSNHLWIHTKTRTLTVVNTDVPPLSTQRVRHCRRVPELAGFRLATPYHPPPKIEGSGRRLPVIGLVEGARASTLPMPGAATSARPAGRSHPRPSICGRRRAANTGEPVRCSGWLPYGPFTARAVKRRPCCSQVRSARGNAASFELLTLHFLLFSKPLVGGRTLSPLYLYFTSKHVCEGIHITFAPPVTSQAGVSLCVVSARAAISSQSQSCGT